MKDDTRLLVKAATLYYYYDLSHHDIAERLGVSRQTVGRMLQRARESGIVTITIHSPLAQISDLESRLAAHFQLREAIVVQADTDDDSSIKQAIGKAAAASVSRWLRHRAVIGLAGSTTVYQCVRHMEPIALREVTVVGLNGAVNRTSFQTHAEYIVHQVARLVGGHTVPLHCPGYVDSYEIKASLLSDTRIKAALDLANRATCAIFGIGDATEQCSPYKQGYFDSDTLQAIRDAGGVGEICGRFFDRSGEPCAPDLSERTIAVDLHSLRQMEYTVALAGGQHKVDAILGAIRGRFCNVLVTDEETALALLETASETTR